MRERYYPDGSQGLYVISVAARLLDMHPQTLRKYERAGFIAPTRTIGMLRLYSSEDINRLRLIKHLVENVGLNLAGIELVLGMAQKLLQLQESLFSIEERDEMQEEVNQVIGEVLRSVGIL